MYRDSRRMYRAALVVAATLAASTQAVRAVTTVDLTDPNSTATVNGTVFTQADVTAAGSGEINAFLRVQGAANGGAETGYNSDFRPVQFDEKTDLQHTHSLLLSDVPTVIKNGVTYRQFIVDNNEPAAASKTLISLDTFKVFLSALPNLTGVSLLNPAAVLGTMVYDLDAGADRSVLFDANLAQGSGKYDALIEIPDAAFQDSANPYVTVLATFGITAQASGGFEEFGVGPITNPTGSTGSTGGTGGTEGGGGTSGGALGTGAGGLVIVPTVAPTIPVPLPAAANAGLVTLGLLAGCAWLKRPRAVAGL